MRASLARPEELGAGELDAWRSMQRSNPEFDSAFLSPGFALAVGRFRPASRVAVLEEGSRVVGLFAFEQGRFGVGRPIGVGVSDRQAVVHTPGFRWDARDLLRACRLEVWEFDHLVAGQFVSAGQHVTGYSSPIIDVSRGYDPYIADRQRTSKKIIKSTFAKERKLEREVGPIRFDFDVEDEQALELLMRWKSAQYRRTGRRDRFSIGWIERLVRDLFESSSAGCTGMLSVLYVGDRVAAVHFGLRSDSTLSCWFPAYDITLAKYSPGLLLHLKMAEAAARVGLDRLDLGKGEAEYKESLKTEDLLVGEGWIERPSTVALVRRLQRAPRRLALSLISQHPVLRDGARRVLKSIGSLRSGS
jgi:CelD/BcsL family acetyltransferase involved in cellulose biosynthesis